LVRRSCSRKSSGVVSLGEDFASSTACASITAHVLGTGPLERLRPARGLTEAHGSSRNVASAQTGYNRRRRFFHLGRFHVCPRYAVTREKFAMANCRSHSPRDAPRNLKESVEPGDRVSAPIGKNSELIGLLSAAPGAAFANLGVRRWFESTLSNCGTRMNRRLRRSRRMNIQNFHAQKPLGRGLIILRGPDGVTFTWLPSSLLFCVRYSIR